MKVQRTNTKSQRQALLQLNIGLQMKTLRKYFLESSLALKTILRMFHKWPKIREFSLALVHHSSQGCVGSQKAHGHELPILIIITALFAYFSPKISLGHTISLSCQHPCTCRKFHIYIEKKISLQWPFWLKDNLLMENLYFECLATQNNICVSELVLSFGKNSNEAQIFVAKCSLSLDTESSQMVLNAHVRKPIPSL